MDTKLAKGDTLGTTAVIGFGKEVLVVGQIVSIHKAGHNYRYVVRVQLGSGRTRDYGVIDPNRYGKYEQVELTEDGRQIIESRGR